MGAMATLMYLVYSRMKGRAHGVASAILLSPAGYHKTAPRLAKLTGPIIDRFLRIYPSFSVFRFPSETIRVIISKMIEDLNNSYTGRIFVGWMISKTIGGDLEDHTFVNMHNLTYNIFTGTSKGIFKHFWQNWLNQRFEVRRSNVVSPFCCLIGKPVALEHSQQVHAMQQDSMANHFLKRTQRIRLQFPTIALFLSLQAFDYGPAGNLEHYGTESPVNFMDNYDKSASNLCVFVC